MPTAIQSYDVEHDISAQGVNELGMRVMQARVWNKRNSKNLLIKSPPASGKSRALMYVAIDKLINQGVKKVIAAVPEKSIGASFKTTDLISSGFFADWEVEDNNNLVSDDVERDEVSKVKSLLRFLSSDDGGVLVCTHSTLREAFKHVESEAFEDCLVAVDEFHHLSVAGDNRLGNVVTELLNNQRTHVLGMTGSYFRGDTNAVLRPEHESHFTVVTFTYYEQLQGYTHLKKINIGHHFYSVVKGTDDAAPYIAGIRELYKPGKKTIIHIPQPNSKESVDKYAEYEAITDIIGDFIETDKETGLSHYKCHKTGKTITVANFVDEGKERQISLNAMQDNVVLDQVDVIIAVRMAMEGFDWPAAEYAITVGSRSSLTQIIQIIGRVTRDYAGKTESTFINLIQEPLADQELVEDAVNDILKAISASLLMEQVISPKFDFKSRSGGANDSKTGLSQFSIEGFNPPKSERVKEILSQDRQALLIDVLNTVNGEKGLSGDAARLIADEKAGADFLNNVIIPKVIATKFGDDELSSDEEDELRQQLMLDLNMPAIEKERKRQKKKKDNDDSKNKKKAPSQTIVDAAKKLNVDDLSLDMVSKVNPFMGAYEIVAHSITPELLLLVRNHIRVHRRGMTVEEAAPLYPAIKRFKSENGRLPDINSASDQEKQLAEALAVLQAARARNNNQQG
jgi:hypothetical protein